MANRHPNSENIVPQIFGRQEAPHSNAINALTAKFESNKFLRQKCDEGNMSLC